MKQTYLNPKQASLVDTLLSESHWLQRVARALVGADAADDLHQDVMVAAMERGPRELSAGGLRPWLRTVARRAATRHRLREQAALDAEWRVAQDRARHGAGGTEAAPQRIPAEQRLDLHRELAASISNLRTGDRDLIVWRYFEGLSVTDVAHRLGLGVDTARKRLSRALARLRAELQGSGRGSEGWWPALVGLAGLPAVPAATAVPAAVSASIVPMALVKVGAMVALLCGGLWLAMTQVVSLQEAPSSPQTVEMSPLEADSIAALSEPQPGVEADADALGREIMAVDGEDADARGHNVFKGRVIDERRFGVPDVRVWLSTLEGDLEAVQTDSEGRFRMENVPLAMNDSDRFSLRALALDGRGSVGPAHVPRAPLGRPIRIEELRLVPTQTATVLALHDGIPTEGARVILQVGKEHGFVGAGITDSNGQVQFLGVPKRSLWARAEVLSMGKAGYGSLPAAASIAGDPLVTVQLGEARELKVQVFDPAQERAPVQGAEVTALVAYEPSTSMGMAIMNFFGPRSSSQTPLEGVRATTGPDGIAVLSGLPQMDIHLRAHHPRVPALVGEATARRGATVADLALARPSPNNHMRVPVAVRTSPVPAAAPRGDAKIAGAAHEPVEGTLAFIIDGVAGLPPAYKLRGNPNVLDEDPARGFVRFRGYPNTAEGGLELTVLLPREFLVIKRTLTALELEQGLPIPVAIARAGVLNVSVIGSLPAATRIVLDHREADGPWERVVLSDQDRPSGEDGAFIFGRLEPGDYRARHAESGAVSEVATFEDGGGTLEVSLNLEARQLVRGKVLAPEGTRLSLIRIEVEGLETPLVSVQGLNKVAHPRGSVQAFANGTFEFFLPAGAVPTLRAWHPLLVPAPEGGEIVLLNPGASAQLQLVAGPTTSLPPQHLDAWARLGKVSRVLLLDPSVGADATAEEVAAQVVQFCPLVKVGERVMFGGYAAGRYSLWIEPEQGFAPVILPDLYLGEGETMVGDIEYSEGARLSLQVNVALGASAPRIHPVLSTVAKFNGKALYRRQLNSSGESEVALPGLGPGRYHLRVRPVGAYRSAPIEFDLTLQAGEDRVLEVDFTGK